MLIFRRFLATAVVASVVIAACTSAATPLATAVPTPAATAAPSKAPDGTLPAPEVTSVKLGTPIGEISQFASVLADQLGLYKKYGLGVTITKMNAGGDVLQALLAGSIDVAHSIGAEVGLTTQLAGTPAKVVSVTKLKVFDGLFCGKDIKAAADVRGKSIAISTLGSAAHASVLLALEALKLTDKDVTIQQVGGQSARLAALKSGAVSCVPVDMSLKPDLDALGLNLLIDLSKTDLQYAGPALYVPQPFLTKNPNTVLALAAAQLEAQNIMITDTATTATEWAKYAQVEPKAATQVATAAVPQLNRTMMWQDSAFVFPQKVFAIINPDIMKADPAKSGDHTILQKLVDLGFYKKLGIPVS